MFSSAIEKMQKPIFKRCVDDFNTKLRLKYDPYYHVIDHQEGVDVTVRGRKMILMSSNEYLGFSSHPKVKTAAYEAVQKWGGSPCGSRLANGSRGFHLELEHALAHFLGKEACHVLSAGYLACVAALAVVQRDDVLLMDRSIHSSLWDEAILSRASLERFSHEDLTTLRQVLTALESSQSKVIVIDGVCSMEGHIAPLAELVPIANEHGAFLIVDDAHGIGV